MLGNFIFNVYMKFNLHRFFAMSHFLHSIVLLLRNIALLCKKKWLHSWFTRTMQGTMQERYVAQDGVSKNYARFFVA
jgi:hypothetical protein